MKMKKREAFKLAQLAVLHDSSLHDDEKLFCLAILIDEERFAAFTESKEETEVEQG